MNNSFKNLNSLKKYPFFRNILFSVFSFIVSIIICIICLCISVEINNNLIGNFVLGFGGIFLSNAFSKIATSIKSIKLCKVCTKKTLTKYEKLFPQIDIELQNYSTINFQSSKIYLTKNYIISYQLGLDIIPLEDITEIIITSKNQYNKFQAATVKAQFSYFNFSNYERWTRSILPKTSKWDEKDLRKDIKDSVDFKAEPKIP